MKPKCTDDCQQCEDYLARAKQRADEGSIGHQAAIAFALIDIAETLREIKALFEREAERGDR